MQGRFRGTIHSPGLHEFKQYIVVEDGRLVD